MMKPSALLVVVALTAAVGPAPADEIEPSPLSVVQALMDAERDTDLELALSLFSRAWPVIRSAARNCRGSSSSTCGSTNRSNSSR